MAKSKLDRDDIRKTLSLSRVLYAWAQQNMRERGYNKNFSAYIADLIRRDKDREDEKKIALGAAVSRPYPPHREQIALIAERPKPKKEKAA